MEVGDQITKCIKARHCHAPARFYRAVLPVTQEAIVTLLRMRNGSAPTNRGKPDKSSVPASPGRQAALFLIVH
jgi:hypothetical protein